MLAGAVNSVAGGGTLLTFPALLWSGHSAIVANATSTVALWPGQLSSLWGYRREIGRSRHVIITLALPSLVGGLTGSLLLLRTPAAAFARLVPYLILLATVLFMIQEPITRTLRTQAAAPVEPEEQDRDAGSAVLQNSSHSPVGLSRGATLSVLLFQYGIAIYGGYFGAGIGILMLAALGVLGFRNIHQMNGLKNINGLCINAVAASLFVWNGLVDWRLALWMALGSIMGGYAGAGAAQRIGQRNVRRAIILIGFALSLSLLLHSH